MSALHSVTTKSNMIKCSYKITNKWSNRINLKQKMAYLNSHNSLVLSGIKCPTKLNPTPKRSQTESSWTMQCFLKLNLLQSGEWTRKESTGSRNMGEEIATVAQVKRWEGQMVHWSKVGPSTRHILLQTLALPLSRVAEEKLFSFLSFSERVRTHKHNNTLVPIKFSNSLTGMWQVQNKCRFPQPPSQL